MPRVLLIDDDHALLAALPEAIAFRMEDAEIVSVANAEDALAHLSASRWDAVITDLLLSCAKGSVLLPAISHLAPDVPVILITGFPDVIWERLPENTFAILRKPFTAQQVVDTLRAALRA
ncbi:response regulator [Candidatus Nitrospira bockiana]